jgi:prepilin-type N-terminal cleavage/methylation domain-containing protein
MKKFPRMQPDLLLLKTCGTRMHSDTKAYALIEIMVAVMILSLVMTV